MPKTAVAAALWSASVSLLLSAGSLQAETINLLAIRVDFQPDSLVTTFGDGSFDSGFDQYSHPYDRPPHNAAYFADHLRFLHYYYNRISGGEVVVNATVYPPDHDPEQPDGPDGSPCHLAHPMWHYNYNDPDLLSLQLVRLFRDAWLSCVDDTSIAFSQYDAFFIFHAGTGQDFGEDFTPFDIPSAYILPGDLELLAEENPDLVDGIPAWDGTLIREGAILPEAEHQEHIAHGLAGTIVLQFGHAIDLPNLYNSETGMPAIGKWGLMDQGSANFRGLIPAQPSAWTRLYKGWGDAQLLESDGDSLRVKSVGTTTADPEIYRIPLTDQEYYLVENRIRDRDGDGLTWGVDAADDTIYFHEDYTFSYSGDTTGVIVAVEDLDYDIPGSGLLIWHIDESRITPQTIAENSINDDPERRGVDLEEGDGVQDIGHSYGAFHPRSGAVAGNFYDAWCDSNAAFLYVNPQLPAVEFSARSIPDTRTNDGWETAVRLFDFSRSDTVMTFSFTASGRLPGYPVETGTALLPLTATLLDAGEEDLLLCLTEDAWLAGFNSGQTELYPDPGGGAQGALPPGENHSVIAFGTADSSRLATLTGTGGVAAMQEWEIESLVEDYGLTAGATCYVNPGHGSLLATADGWLLWGGATAELIEGATQTVWSFDGAILQAGLLADNSWLLVENEGLYTLIQGDWELLHACAALADAPAPVSGVCNPLVDTSSWLVLRDADWLVCITAAGSERWRRYLPGIQELALSDLDADGVLELVVATAAEILLLSPAGVELGARDFTAGQLRVFPGPAEQQGLYATDAHTVTAWSYQGSWAPLSGFPRTLPHPDSELLYSPAGRYYLIDSAALNGYSAQTGTGPLWAQRGGDHRHSYQLPEPSPYLPQPTAAWVEGRVWSWPNPSRQGETIHLNYTVATTADVEINIYDRTGRRVTGFSDQVNPWSTGESLWDVSGVASGIYYAHLEARCTGGGELTEILKLAVIK